MIDAGPGGCASPLYPGTDMTRRVVFDVDGVISNGAPAGPSCVGRPGMQFMFDVLTALGFEVHLWSAGGADHARTVAEQFTLHGSVRGYHDKPDLPMTEAAAEERLGFVPVLTIDDEPTERVGAWPFFLIDGFFARAALLPSTVETK